jgi:hypothetical protein
MEIQDALGGVPREPVSERVENLIEDVRAPSPDP